MRIERSSFGRRHQAQNVSPNSATVTAKIVPAADHQLGSDIHFGGTNGMVKNNISREGATEGATAVETGGNSGQFHMIRPCNS